MRERRHFEVIESRQMDHLRVFHDVARTLTTSLDLAEILLAIMEKMASFFGPERWSLLMVDEKTNELYYAIAVGQDATTLRNLRIPMGEGVAGWVAQTGNPLVVPDISLDPHWFNFSRTHPELHIQSIACVPIRSAEKTLGVIQLLNSKLDLLSEYSISFLRILCDYAAIAIGNARSLQLIQELSITDDATGLFNARRLYAVLEEQVQLAPTPFCLLFIDLDHFKRVNDEHGHLAGSKVLKEVADLFRSVLESAGADNLGFRYGGDEFVVLMRQADKATGTALATLLCQTLREATFLRPESLELRISGSFGLATFPEDGDSVQSMLRVADREMYQIKNTTRNDVAVASKASDLERVTPPRESRVYESTQRLSPHAPTRVSQERASTQADAVPVVQAAAVPAAAHRGSRGPSDGHQSPRLQG